MLNNLAALYTSGVAPELGAWESISTTTVGSGGTSSISFTVIPSTYKHLQIRALSRISSSTEINLLIKFNSDAGNNYTGHYLYGDGASAGSGALAANNTPPFAIRTSNSSSNANVFGGSVTDILDYANTNKYKTVRNLSGVDNNGSGSIFMVSDLWMNTAAISQIDIIPNGGTIAQYSSFALYGIKG